jgi:hypothetical protein
MFVVISPSFKWTVGERGPMMIVWSQFDRRRTHCDTSLQRDSRTMKSDSMRRSIGTFELSKLTYDWCVGLRSFGRRIHKRPEETRVEPKAAIKLICPFGHDNLLRRPCAASLLMNQHSRLTVLLVGVSSCVSCRCKKSRISFIDLPVNCNDSANKSNSA